MLTNEYLFLKNLRKNCLMANSSLHIVQDIPKRPGHPSDIVKEIRPRDLEGLKVVFMHMPLREQAWPPVALPEGPLLMATRLRNEFGVKAGIIDLNGYRKENPNSLWSTVGKYRYYNPGETFQLIKDHIDLFGEPDVIAFSGMITTLRWQEIVAKMIRQILPNVFLISGGGLATDLKAALLKYIPELDAIARSEGDDVIVKIVHDAKVIKQRGWLGAISSGHLKPYYAGELYGRHRLIYEGARPRDLDILPLADLDLLAYDVYGHKKLEEYIKMAVWGLGSNNSSAAPFTMNRSTTSVSTRGCPHACRYCDRIATGGRLWGAICAERLAELLIRNIQKYGIDFHGWVDDNMPVDPRRIAAMVPLIRPLNIFWGTHGRLDEISGLKPYGKTFENPLRVKNMADAGCRYIGAGAESASKRVLEAIGKGGHTLKNGFEMVEVGGERCEFALAMTEAIRKAREHGIHVNCTWIMLSPTETLEDLKHTVKFIKWEEEHYAGYGIPSDAVNKQMFTMTYYPGTELVQHPKVRSELQSAFGVKFDPQTNQPIFDENFHQYCLELDDATKLLYNPKTGQPVNFSEIPNEQAIQAREHVDSGQIEKILDM